MPLGESHHVPRVLVTDARLGSAVAIIRSLGRRGMHVIAADAPRLSAGFYSRHTADRLRYPSPESAPGDVVETLLREARSRRVDLIVPVTDELVLPLSGARDLFDGVCALALPSAESLEIALDKLKTLELARSLGIPTPLTAVVDTVGDSLAAAGDLGWPLVLKPQASRALRDEGGIDAFGVTYANDAAGLAEAMERFEGRCSVLLQEYCSGEARGVGILADCGSVLAAFEHRRLREVPIFGGASSFRESVELDPGDYESAKRLLGALEWTGLAMVELKGPPGAARLMEINGRVWGSIPLAVKSGVDFPARAVDLYLGGSNGSVQERYAVGVRSRDLRLELSWIASVARRRRQYPFISSPRRREAIGPALSLVRPRDGFDVLSLRDPWAGVVEIAGLAPRLWRKAATKSPRARGERAGVRGDETAR